MSAAGVCLWCDAPFTVGRRRGRDERRFCRDGCRLAFHKAARQWAIRAVEEGRLTVADIRSGHGEPYTAQRREVGDRPVPDGGQCVFPSCEVS